MNLKKLLAATVCVFIIGVAIYLCSLLLANELVYLQRGVSTDGVVLQKMEERSVRRNSGSAGYVTFEYEVDGLVLQNESMLDVRRGYDSIEQGDVIQIVYDPQNPESSRPHLAAPWVRYSLVIVFIFGMSSMFAYVPVRILRQS